MTTEEKVKVMKLIKQHCIPSNRYYKWSSYSLKEVFEKLAGCYISNDEFKILMRKAGFIATPRSRNEINHRYKLRVSESPGISIYFRGNGAEAYKYNDKI